MVKYHSSVRPEEKPKYASQAVEPAIKHWYKAGSGIADKDHDKLLGLMHTAIADKYKTQKKAA